jgi:hypothetical protein
MAKTPHGVLATYVPIVGELIDTCTSTWLYAGTPVAQSFRPEDGDMPAADGSTLRQAQGRQAHRRRLWNRVVKERFIYKRTLSQTVAKYKRGWAIFRPLCRAMGD